MTQTRSGEENRPTPRSVHRPTLAYLLALLCVGCSSSPGANTSDMGLADARARDATPTPDSAAATSCTLGGVTLSDGEAADFYLAEIVDGDGDGCATLERVRTCTDGVLSGPEEARHARCSSLREALVRGGEISIPEGSFTLVGEIELDSAATIRGAGKDKTILRFAVDRYQPALRIVASDVTIEDLQIEVELTEPLAKFPGEGGRGEYGTAITIGRVLHTQPHERVKNIRVANVTISRKPKSYVAAAMGFFGRTEDVVVRDVTIAEHHSTVAIIHWGAHSSDAPNPDAYYRDGHQGSAPDLKYHESYHPHGIQIANVEVLDHKVARFLVISSAYDLDIGHWKGRTSELALLLPGDEINRYAVAADKQRVHSAIRVHNMDVALKPKANDYAIRTTSYGTSKVDQQKRRLPMKDVVFEDITITAVDQDASSSYRYGINAHQTDGEGVIFRRIDLAGLGTYDFFDESDKLLPSYGVFMRDAAGITVDEVRTRARYGFGVADSRDITIKNSRAVHEANGSTKTSYGIFISDKGAPVYSNERITIEKVSIDGYDVGIAYPAANPCDPLTLDALTFNNVGLTEKNGTCL